MYCGSQPEGGKETPCVDEPPRAEEEAQAEETGNETDSAAAEVDGGNEAPSSDEQPPDQPTDQFDDLLFPTQEESGAIKTGSKDAEKAGQPEQVDDASKAEGTTPADALPASNTAAANSQTQAAPVISIESDVDPESWAEYGGWYRQDYAIYYRPTGHKDKFIHSWLVMTGPQAQKGGTSPAAAVFDFLTSKDAQGSCTKCHSVDDIRGKGRVVNFSPVSLKSQTGTLHEFHPRAAYGRSRQARLSGLP